MRHRTWSGQKTQLGVWKLTPRVRAAPLHSLNTMDYTMVGIDAAIERKAKRTASAADSPTRKTQP